MVFFLLKHTMQECDLGAFIPSLNATSLQRIWQATLIEFIKLSVSIRIKRLDLYVDTQNVFVLYFTEHGSYPLIELAVQGVDNSDL